MDLIREYDFDSLSFLENDYDQPHIADAVHRMISNEMSTFTPEDYTAKYNSVNFKFVNSPALQSYWEDMIRTNGKFKSDKLHNTRLAVEAMDPALEEDPNRWKSMIRNAKSQIEYQNIKQVNAELSVEHDGKAWLNYNKVLTEVHEGIDNEIKRKRKRIDEINSFRRKNQERAYYELSKLEAKKRDVTSEYIRVASACHDILRVRPDAIKAVDDISCNNVCEMIVE